LQKLHKEILSKEFPSSLNIFREHTGDIIEYVNILFRSAEVAKSRKIKEGFLYLIDIILGYYLTQYQFFQLSLSSMKEKELWNALENLLKYLADQLNLRTTPMPILGDDYYSTGSFMYFRELSSFAPRLKTEYYFIAVDYLDLPLFWPLVAHEIAHCWLSETRYVDEACALEVAQEIKKETGKSLENKIEEVLCDLVATKIFGSAYPWAYITRLWLHLNGKDFNTHPSHSFRIECMCSQLENMGMYPAAEKIRALRDERVKEGWQREVIWQLKEYLIGLSDEFPSIADREHYVKSLSIVKRVFTSPPEDPVLLFMTCWNHLQLSNLINLEKALPKYTSVILKVLRG